MNVTVADDDYEVFRDRARENFAAVPSNVPLFTTNATRLFDTFLQALPTELRQHYTCRTCRQFIDTYGGLVTVLDDGTTSSVLWRYFHGRWAPFGKVVIALLTEVEEAKITGVFYASSPTLGHPTKGGWTHFFAEQGQRTFRATALTNAEQAMAEKKEEHHMLRRALGDFGPQVIRQAVSLLEADALYRSEKVLGVATWLRDLVTEIERVGNTPRGNNLLWRAVATAPPGFAHVRSSMIGTLLEDLADARHSIETIKRRFAEKMHPLQYQRPTAAPSEGQIAQAERIVSELGAAGALRRRYAQLEECQLMWRPSPLNSPASGKGVFDHLRKQASPAREVPGGVMTWEKFARTVLPHAAALELKPPTVGNFTALVTAVDPKAPPILQWDHEDRRNPVNLYVYSGGSSAERWGLSPFHWAEVTGVALLPSMWNGGNEHHGKGVVLLLDGMRERSPANLALFPEVLRSEFHGVRKTIEAFSQRGRLEGLEEASACGLCLRGGQGGPSWNAQVRVTRVDGEVLTYTLDRWD